MVRKGQAREGGDQRKRRKQMQNLFWAACGKWGGGKCDKVGVLQQRKWLGGLCAHPVDSGWGGTWENELQSLWGGYKLVVDMAHIEDVCGGLLGESMGQRSSFSPFLIL